MASLVASTGSRHAGSVVAAHGLSCLVHSMWNLPRPGTESVSPTLAGGFSTTEPRGKPQSGNLKVTFLAFSGMIFKTDKDVKLSTI